MSDTNDYQMLSNTRGASLVNLTRLCYILGSGSHELNVKALANEAISRGVFDTPLIPLGGRLPTRIHHHMIALRKVDLVQSEQRGSNIHYSLKRNGKAIFEAAKQEGVTHIHELSHELKATWRLVLVDSSYVRFHWLKYFMQTDDFNLRGLLEHSTPITLYRVPTNEREDHFDDSGYRLFSSYWQEKAITDLEYKEIFQGLRKWTNEVFLTDDRIPEELNTPYLHQTLGAHAREIESHIVVSWLNPKSDIERFRASVESLMNTKRKTRMPIPELIIGLSEMEGYAKSNIRQLLVELYYSYPRQYFFERGSEFLINHAFDTPHPEDYYVQIEGVWRIGIVRAR